jgi:formate-dependent nitrite reductase cytochrome c552 subunit
MPRVKAKGKPYTFHGQRSARYILKDTCVRCHPKWTAEEAEYQVDAIQNYIRGKMRKAEFWLGELINAFIRAKELGVSEDILKEARKEHDRAHILWEWWTAENSDGFHNPEAARQSLAESINASQKGVEILNKAILQKTAAK